MGRLARRPLPARRRSVDPALRRGGVATRLVEEVERRMRALGAERVPIRVFHREPGAVAFWEALGYVAEPDESIFAKSIASQGRR
ncbi:MAG: GNAT family N-acetyltransferase [Chloroflexi bacterium]|nr:GNAT family N-acetyltransferase [Chloroflexota bacterium]